MKVLGIHLGSEYKGFFLETNKTYETYEMSAVSRHERTSQPQTDGVEVFFFYISLFFLPVIFYNNNKNNNKKLRN